LVTTDKEKRMTSQLHIGEIVIIASQPAIGKRQKYRLQVIEMPAEIIKDLVGR